MSDIIDKATVVAVLRAKAAELGYSEGHDAVEEIIEELGLIPEPPKELHITVAVPEDRGLIPEDVTGYVLNAMARVSDGARVVRSEWVPVDVAL